MSEEFRFSLYLAMHGCTSAYKIWQAKTISYSTLARVDLNINSCNLPY
jgi:hypothetical protein